MTMECVIGFLSKLLIFTFKDEAVEVHGDVLLAVHLKSSISKPPYICHMFSKLVSKEASGSQESNKAPHSHIKICFQPKNEEKTP